MIKFYTVPFGSALFSATHPDEAASSGKSCKEILPSPEENAEAIEESDCEDAVCVPEERARLSFEQSS